MGYAGKTSRLLKQRMSEQKNFIRRNDRDYPIEVHFNYFKHDVSSFRFQSTEKVNLLKKCGNLDEILN